MTLRGAVNRTPGALFASPALAADQKPNITTTLVRAVRVLVAYAVNTPRLRTHDLLATSIRLNFREAQVEEDDVYAAVGNFNQKEEEQ